MHFFLYNIANELVFLQSQFIVSAENSDTEVCKEKVRNWKSKPWLQQAESFQKKNNFKLQKFRVIGKYVLSVKCILKGTEKKETVALKTHCMNISSSVYHKATLNVSWS